MSWGERAVEQYEKDQPSEPWWRWDQNPVIYINPKDEWTHNHDNHDED